MTAADKSLVLFDQFEIYLIVQLLVLESFAIPYLLKHNLVAQDRMKGLRNNHETYLDDEQKQLFAETV